MPHPIHISYEPSNFNLVRIIRCPIRSKSDQGKVNLTVAAESGCLFADVHFLKIPAPGRIRIVIEIEEFCPFGMVDRGKLVDTELLQPTG